MARCPLTSHRSRRSSDRVPTGGAGPADVEEPTAIRRVRRGLVQHTMAPLRLGDEAPDVLGIGEPLFLDHQILDAEAGLVEEALEPRDPGGRLQAVEAQADQAVHVGSSV